MNYTSIKRALKEGCGGSTEVPFSSKFKLQSCQESKEGGRGGQRSSEDLGCSVYGS